MRRALSRFSDENFDLLVIGGGITGACIVRDAARRGLRCALVEKGDFASAASSANSKLIHGGLRYLRNFELHLVRESLRERRIWQRIAPHLVQPLTFLLPVSGGERAKLSLGLTLYDWLAFDRTWLDDPLQRLPGHQWLGQQTVVAREAVLDSPTLKGAFVYYDAQMYSPERLALECLSDADAHGAVIANYVEAERLLLRDGRVSGATARDRFSSDAFDVQAKETIVATGPWTDLFLKRALCRPVSHKLLRSKGIHLIVPALTKTFALTFAAEKRHFFVLPWHGHSLIGTTDTPIEGDPDEAHATTEDIADFLAFVKRHLPGAHLALDSVERAFAGVRPLVQDGAQDTYQASRSAEIVDHGREDGLAGLISVTGGKWTTSRALAQTTVDRAAEMIHAQPRACVTSHEVLPGGRFSSFLAFERALEAKHPSLSSMPHLARLYGAQLPDVLALGDDDLQLLKPIGTAGDIAAQIVHAVRNEMAMTLEDVVMRRTCIGQFASPSPEVLESAAGIMARELKWNAVRRHKEVEAVKRLFQA